MNQKIAKKVRLAVKHVTSFTLLITIINGLIFFFATKKLPVETVGTYAFTLAIFEMLYLFVNTSSDKYYIKHKQAGKKVFNQIFSAEVLISLLLTLGCVTYLFFGSVDDPLFFSIFIPTLLCKSFLHIGIAHNEKRFLFKENKLWQLNGSIGFMASFFVLVMSPWNTYALPAGYLIGQVIYAAGVSKNFKYKIIFDKKLITSHKKI